MTATATQPPAAIAATSAFVAAMIVTEHDCDLTNEWWEKFQALSPTKLEKAKKNIALNKFKDGDFKCGDKKVLEVLKYYQITRNDAEN